MGCKSSKLVVNAAQSARETDLKDKYVRTDISAHRLECLPDEIPDKTKMNKKAASSDASRSCSDTDINKAKSSPIIIPEDNSKVPPTEPEGASLIFEENTVIENNVAESLPTIIPDDSSTVLPSVELVQNIGENSDADNNAEKPSDISTAPSSKEAAHFFDELDDSAEKDVLYTGFYDKPCLASDDQIEEINLTHTVVVTPQASPESTSRRCHAASSTSATTPSPMSTIIQQLLPGPISLSSEFELYKNYQKTSPEPILVTAEQNGPASPKEGRGSEMSSVVSTSVNKIKTPTPRKPSPVKSSVIIHQSVLEPISLSTEMAQQPLRSTTKQNRPAVPSEGKGSREIQSTVKMDRNESEYLLPAKETNDSPEPAKLNTKSGPSASDPETSSDENEEENMKSDEIDFNPSQPQQTSIVQQTFSSFISLWRNTSDTLKRFCCFNYIMKVMRGSFNLVAIFCAILTFTLHAITINGDFVWDDRAALSNPDVLGQRSLLELFRHDFWGQEMALEKSHKSWRPAAVLSLRLSHKLYGPNARGFHFDNVLLHAAITYCYSAFCFQLTKSYMKEAEKTAHTTAILASVVFAVHPIHTEPVASIVGRSDLLCGFFFIVAIMLKRAGGNESKSRYLTLAALAGVLSTLAKEVGVMVFAIFTASDAMDLLFRVSAFNKSTMENFARHTAANFTCALLLTAVHMSLHGNVKIYDWTILENSISLFESKTGRSLSYANVAALYVWKMVYPFNLSYDWGWPCINHVTGVSDFRNVRTLLVATSLLCLGYYSLKRRNAILLWGFVLATVPFLPASNLFFPVGTILAERLLYIPSMGFCLCTGYFMAQLCHEDDKGGIGCGIQLVKKTKGVSFIFLCAYICWMSFKTIHRCTEWSTEANLFESALHVCPKSLKVLNNYAQLYLEADPQRAIPFLDNAIEMHEEYSAAHFNKGIAHNNRGEQLDAIRSFTKSLDLSPNNDKVRHLLGGALLSHAKTLLGSNNAEAEEYLLRAIGHVNDSIENINANDPRALHLRCEIGNALSYDAMENLRFCNAALDANRQEKSSSNIDEDVALNLLGIISKQMRKYDDAVEYFTKGLEVNSESYDILINLASIHTDKGNFETAGRYFKQAEALDISDPSLRAFVSANKGWYKEKQGLRLAARDLYSQAISLSQPNPHPQIVTNLKNIDRYCDINHCE